MTWLRPSNWLQVGTTALFPALLGGASSTPPVQPVRGAFLRQKSGGFQACVADYLNCGGSDIIGQKRALFQRYADAAEE